MIYMFKAKRIQGVIVPKDSKQAFFAKKSNGALQPKISNIQ